MTTPGERHCCTLGAPNSQEPELPFIRPQQLLVLPAPCARPAAAGCPTERSVCSSKSPSHLWDVCLLEALGSKSTNPLHFHVVNKRVHVAAGSVNFAMHFLHSCCLIHYLIRYLRHPCNTANKTMATSSC